MPLTSREAFKCGFLARCAEDGLSPEGMLRRAKAAREKVAVLGTLINKTVDVGKGVVDASLGWGIPLALAAPPILGGIGGAALAKATDIDDQDVEDIKDKELLDEYRRQTAQLRRHRLVRDYQDRKRRAPGRIYL